MKKKLKEDLRKIATQIVSDRDTDTIADLYKYAQTLYEKLTVLKFVDEKLNDIEVDVSNNVIVNKFEKMANSVLDANTKVPENNPHNEDIIIPGIDTIKDMVSEMPVNENDDNSRSDFLGKPNFLKNDTELFVPTNENEIKKKITEKSLNDKSNGQEIKVDLNNRLAFVKHLFNGSTEDYNRVLSQLSTIDTKERSVLFIKNMIKPDYNNWEGKEEYAERFMDLIERRFTR
jgi:hypothetical protein